jgi:hypothetical protein
MDKLISFLMIIYIMVGTWISLAVIDEKIFNIDITRFNKNFHRYITYLDLIIIIIFLPLFCMGIIFYLFLILVNIIPNKLSKKNIYKKLNSTIFKRR